MFMEGLMLKLQYFGHLMQRASSLEKTLMLGKIEGKRRKGRQRMRWLDGITDLMATNLSKLREIVEDRGVLPSRGSQRIGHDLVCEQQRRIDCGPLGGASRGLRKLSRPPQLWPLARAPLPPGGQVLPHSRPRVPLRLSLEAPLTQPPTSSCAFPHPQPCLLFHQIFSQRGGATI